MSLHRRNEPWLKVSKFRRKSLVKPLVAEVLEPRCLLTDTTGTVDIAGATSDGESNSNSLINPNAPPLPDGFASEELWMAAYRQWLIAVGAGPGESSDSENGGGVDGGSSNGGSRGNESGLSDGGTHRDPNAEPIPGYYASQELWLAAYEQWLIDKGFISDPESNSSTDASSEANDVPPRLEDYASEDLWLVDYQQWLIAVGAGPAELTDSNNGNDVVADVGRNGGAPALTNSILLIGQGIATVGIEDRELAKLDTVSSDSAFGELADTEQEDGEGPTTETLADSGDVAANADAVDERLELDAALSHLFLELLAD